MKPPDIIEVTLKVIKIFEKLNIGYYVGGSIASSAYGIARATLDVDIIADIKLNQASAIEDSLKEKFYVDVDMIRNAIEKQSSFNLIHLDTMFKIDVFILKDEPFSVEAYSRRLQKVVSEDSSEQLYFSTPEDTILSKLAWFKSGKEGSERQWRDILGVLKVQGKQLDMSYIKLWAGKLGVLELLMKAFHDSGVI